MDRPDGCQFCHETEGLIRCAWPAERFIVARYRDLTPGDRVRRFHQDASLEPRPAAIVAEIEDRGSFYNVVLQIPGRRKYGFKSVNVMGASFVRVLRGDVCAAAACFRHHREIGEGRAYCADHWNAWESAA